MCRASIQTRSVLSDRQCLAISGNHKARGVDDGTGLLHDRIDGKRVDGLARHSVTAIPSSSAHERMVLSVEIPVGTVCEGGTCPSTPSTLKPRKSPLWEVVQDYPRLTA